MVMVIVVATMLGYRLEWSINKMIAHAHKYCDVLTNDDPLLEGFIKNVNDCERVYEEVNDNTEKFSLNTNIVDRTSEFRD